MIFVVEIAGIMLVVGLMLMFVDFIIKRFK